MGVSRLFPVCCVFFAGLPVFFLVQCWCGVFFFPSSSVGVSVLPSLSVLSRSACRLGASGFSCRPSARALGGFVVAAGFRGSGSASAFAARWAAVLPAWCGGCVVRLSGGLWWVSVPVLPASVPAVVRSGAPLVAVGAPPAVRAAVAAGGVWSVWPAPGSRRRAFAAFFALGWPLPPRPASALPVFGSRSLARGWAVACGVAPFCVPSACGGWVSAPGPAVSPSCLFCGLLGACVAPVGGAGCAFRPWRSLPGWPAAVPSPVLSRPLFSLPVVPVFSQLPLFR